MEQRLIWNDCGDYYEGEVCNNEPHGLGTIYSNNQRVLQGTFCHGVMHGEGREYAEEGYLLYEGEFAYDSYCGYGTSYYPNGQIKRQGQFQGHALQEGCVYLPNGELLKEGRFWQKKLHGYGQLYAAELMQYEGIFFQDILIGLVGSLSCNPFFMRRVQWLGGQQAKLEMNGYTVLFSFAGELQHGETKLYDATEQLVASFTFEHGQFVYEKRFAHNRLTLEGAVKDGYLNGWGKRYNEQGETVYEGYLVNGQRHGEGKAFLRQGRVLEAIFEDNLQVGKARLYEDGMLRYEGEMCCELIDGEGTYYYADGTYFVGQMYAHFPLQGTYYDADGQVIGTENRQLQDLQLFVELYK